MIHWLKVDPSLLAMGFKNDVEKFLRESPYTWGVTFGYRTLEEQDALHRKYLAGGPRAAPKGRSAHNYGLAVDIVLDGSDKPGIQMEWNTKLAGWLWLKAASIKHPRLRTGWKYSDFGHLEAVGWESEAKRLGY